MSRNIGTVKFFNTNKGYGFISPDSGGKDVFVHITAAQQSGMGTLSEGDRIVYGLEERNGKTCAVDLRSA